jgi:peptide/nickel transport system substrate-binding protein
MRNRFLLVFFVAAVLGLVFSACNPEDTNPPEEQASPTVPETGVAPPTLPPGSEPGITTPMPPGGAVQDAEPAQPDPVPPPIFWTPPRKQAVAAAIDREVLVDRVFEGNADSAYHTLPRGYQISGDPFFQRYGTRDLELSISLLSEEGFTEDEPFVLDLWAPLQPPSLNGESVLNVIKDQLEETGLIRVNYHTPVWEEYLDLIEAGEVHLFILGRAPDFADPDNWLSPFASCALSPEKGIHYCNPVMDEMLHLAAASSGEHRERVYEEIGSMFASDPPVIPLYWEQEPLVYREGIQGPQFGPTFVFHYSTLQFTENARPAAGSPETAIIGTTEQFEKGNYLGASTFLERDIFNNTGLPLMRFLPGTIELAPGAAADFPSLSQDGVEYTFQLRQGLKYSDGTPVSSQDYVRSWEKIKELEDRPSGMLLRYVEDVQAPDDRTLVYRLSGVNTFFPALAATSWFLPLHPDYLETDGQDLAYTATGPYLLLSHSPETETILEVNPEYIGDEIPAISTVIIRYYEDAAALARAVEAGEIDLAWRGMDLIETFRIQNMDALLVEMVNSQTLHYLAFNHLFLGEGRAGFETEE